MLSSKKWATLSYDTEEINRPTKHICILSLRVQKTITRKSIYTYTVSNSFNDSINDNIPLTGQVSNCIVHFIFLCFFCLEKREKMFFRQKLLFAFTSQICNKTAVTHQNVGHLIQEINTTLVHTYVFIQIPGYGDPYSWRVLCVPVVQGAVLLEGIVPGKVSKIKLVAREWLDKERFGDSSESRSTGPDTLTQKKAPPGAKPGRGTWRCASESWTLLHGAHLSIAQRCDGDLLGEQEATATVHGVLELLSAALERELQSSAVGCQTLHGLQYNGEKTWEGVTGKKSPPVLN